MDDNVLQKPVLKDYGVTVVTESVSAGTNTDPYLYLDGDGDYIAAGSSLDLNSVSFSVCAWVRRDSIGATHYIFGQGATGSANIALHIGFRDSNVFTFAFYGDDLNTPSSYTDTDWHHWACTYNASTNARLIYRDGSQVANDTATADFQGSGTVYIANAPYSSLLSLHGAIKDVLVYDDVLTSGEVSTIYGGGTVSSGLIRDWKINEGTGTSADDDSGNADTGTHVGDPEWFGSYDYTIDLNKGNVFDTTLDGDTAFTFSNPPASGVQGSFTLILTQDETGNRIVTWPSAVVWPGGTEPTLSTLGESTDILTFSTIDGGTTWFGSLSASFNPPAPTTLTYITGTHNGGTSNDSITLPATLLAGDLGVLIAGARNGGNNCSDNVPGDFTMIARSAGSTPNLDYMDVVYAKILETSDISRTINTVNGDAEGNNFFVFRPDTTIHGFDWDTWEVETSGASQPAQDSWDLSVLTTPAVMFGYVGADGGSTPSFTTASPAFDNTYQVSSSGLGRYISGYKIYNSAGSTHNIRGNDSGDDNTQMTGYIRVY